MSVDKQALLNAANEEAVRASQDSQLVNAVIDSSGFCQFLMPNLDEVREFYGLFYGEEVTREQIADQGWQCLQDEWAFNERAGFTKDDDDLPGCMKDEGVGPDHVMKFDVDADTIAAAKQRFAHLLEHEVGNS